MSQSPPKPATRTPALDAAQYREIFNALEQGYCIFEMLVDSNGRPFDYRFIEVNVTFEQQTGLVNVVGRTALELVPNLEPHWVETYGRVAETGEPLQFEQDSDAMGRRFKVLATRVGAPERRLVALLFSDITAHRQEQEERRKTEEALRQSEHRLDIAVTSGDVGLWCCDLPFDKLVWNAKVKEHFGLPPDAEVTIDTFYDRMFPEDREKTRLAIDASIATRTSYDTQYRTVGLDGRIRWIRAIGHTVYEGDHPVRFDGITVDITELMALRESAEAASRAKDEFLAMLGHELRNPLAPILTALQLLKLGASRPASTSARSSSARSGISSASWTTCWTSRASRAAASSCAATRWNWPMSWPERSRSPAPCSSSSDTS